MKKVKAVMILTTFLFLANNLVTAQPVAFTNVTVIDVAEGGVDPDMTVVVTCDRITGVGRSDQVKVPDNAQTKAEKIDSLLTRYHEYRLFNGAVLVADNREVIYQKGFGHANMEWDVQNTPETKFLIASITKQFTAALILKLAEQDLIDLQGKITDYLPDYPKENAHGITIHHLLSHTSGIPSYTGFPQFDEEIKRKPFSPDSFVSVFSSLDQEFEPGSDYAYSNSGYFLLGIIAEKVTGKSYAEALRQYILTPLDLDQTGYYTNAEIIDQQASGYVRTPVGYRAAAYIDSSIPYSAGMLYSTVGDLYTWDQTLYENGPFEKPETAKLFLSPQKEVMASNPDYPDEIVSSAAGYGLFFESIKIGIDTLETIFHDGSIDGFSTMLYRVPKRGQTVIIWDNTEGRWTDALTLTLVGLLNGQPAPAPKRPIADVVAEVTAQEGINAGITRYQELKATASDAYDFEERGMAELGALYLERGDLKEALRIFQLNRDTYPESHNVYYRLATAYRAMGEIDEVVLNLHKSLELNPDNQRVTRMLKAIKESRR